jgi:hypothetical protein
MPTQHRQKRTGALLFQQTKDENQAVKDRREMREMRSELQKLKDFIYQQNLLNTK